MDMRHPHFAEPGWLWLAVLAPVALVALQRYAGWARARQLGFFAAPELLADLLRSHSPARRVVKNILLVLGIAGMGVALARPQWGETTEVSTTLGEDILFVVDCSRSMLATDVAPNRLERSKYAILDFVQKHGRGRMGLVAFSGQAFLQCPLTFDYDAFREALLSLDEKAIPVPGTDIGRSLDEGFRAMEKNQRHKIMILVTDGEDLEKSGVTTAKGLAEKSVVIYTVGVGTPAGSPIQILTDQNKQDFVRDSSGKVVQSHLDETTLREIAEATHGAYQPLGSLGEGFNQVRHLVETSANSADYSRARKLGVDRFYFPVAAVIFLMVTESLIGTRRKVVESRSGEI
jgi:Ca-activated chloride channel family protein